MIRRVDPRFPVGARVRMTERGRQEKPRKLSQSGGMGIVVGYTRSGWLKVLPDNYQWSTAICDPANPDHWEPTGEMVPRERWHPSAHRLTARKGDNLLVSEVVSELEQLREAFLLVGRHYPDHELILVPRVESDPDYPSGLSF